MRGVKLAPLPGEGDPDSLASFRTRYLAWLAVRNFSGETIESRGRDLYAFIVWCAERGLGEPREITKPILERYQRHLHALAQGGWPAVELPHPGRPAGAGSGASSNGWRGRTISCPTRRRSWSCRAWSGACRPPP